MERYIYCGKRTFILNDIALPSVLVSAVLNEGAHSLQVVCRVSVSMLIFFRLRVCCTALRRQKVPQHTLDLMVNAFALVVKVCNCWTMMYSSLSKSFLFFLHIWLLYCKPPIISIPRLYAPSYSVLWTQKSAEERNVDAGMYWINAILLLRSWLSRTG